MFVRRSPLDFLFFSGTFLIIESLLSFQWYVFVQGGIYESNGIPVTNIQMLLLFVGVVLAFGSGLFMKFFREENERILPSAQLFYDFSFIVGVFIGMTALLYYGTCWLYCDFPNSMANIFAFLFSPILVGASIYGWNRERKEHSKPFHTLGWEVFSTIAISILLLEIFLFQGILASFNFYFSPLTAAFATISCAGGITGLLKIHASEKKFAIPTRSFVAQKSSRSVKIVLAVLTVSALFASAGLSFFTGSLNLNPCGGGFGFGLYGCNVRTITISSVTLYGGHTGNSSSPATSYLIFALSNPSQETTISSLSLTGDLRPPVTQWSYSSEGRNPVNFNAPYSAKNANALNASSVSVFTYYPLTPTSIENITFGQTFNYVINFGNGDSVSGALIAQ